jgi:hypothetical protein
MRLPTRCTALPREEAAVHHNAEETSWLLACPAHILVAFTDATSTAKRTRWNRSRALRESAWLREPRCEEGKIPGSIPIGVATPTRSSDRTHEEE